MALEVAIPKRQEVWSRFPLWEARPPRAQSGEFLAPLPVGEVRSSRNVTSGPEEVIKAVDLLGGVLAGPWY